MTIADESGGRSEITSGPRVGEPLSKAGNSRPPALFARPIELFRGRGRLADRASAKIRAQLGAQPRFSNWPRRRRFLPRRGLAAGARERAEFPKANDNKFRYGMN